MTIQDLLKGTNPYTVRVRYRYARLSAAERQALARGFERHKRACLSIGIEPDPSWVAEAVDDMAKGILRAWA